MYEPITGFYTQAIWSAVNQNPGAHRTLYTDSAKAVFTYTPEDPRGNNRVLSAEEVVHLIETDRQDHSNYNTTLKVQALHSLIIIKKDREEYYRDAYRGLIGTLRRVCSLIYHSALHRRWMDGATRDRELLQKQIIKINNEIEWERSFTRLPAIFSNLQASATAEIAAMKLVEESEISEAPIGEEKPRINPVDVQAAVRGKLARQQFLEGRATRIATPAKPTVKPPPVFGPKEELETVLKGEAVIIDLVPNGPCSLALKRFFSTTLENATLLKFEALPEEGGRKVYQMTLAKERTGTPKSSVPTPVAIVLKSTIRFTLNEEGDNKKILTFIDNSVVVRIGYGFLSVDRPLQVAFDRQGCIACALQPLGTIDATIDDVCEIIQDLNWT